MTENSLNNQTSPKKNAGRENSDFPEHAQAKNAAWTDLGSHVFIKAAIIAGLFWWLFHLQLELIVYRWANDPSWSHGFLIPLFSLYFLNQNKSELINTRPKPFYPAIIAIIALIIFHFLNISYFMVGTLKPLTALGTLFFIVLMLGGFKVIKYTWLPILYLVFAVPLPQRLYERITIPMRIFAAKISNATLNLVPELEASTRGVIIDVIYKGEAIESLNVAEACSGMRLLMAFVALGVAMAYLHYRPVWQRIILLISTIPIAIFCNVVRVTVTGFIYVLGDPKYAKGIYHDGLGMLMLPLAFILYGLLAKFMNNLFIEVEEDTDNKPQEDIIVSKKKKQESSGGQE
jgi:exosortase